MTLNERSTRNYMQTQWHPHPHSRAWPMLVWCVCTQYTNNILCGFWKEINEKKKKFTKETIGSVVDMRAARRMQ